MEATEKLKKGFKKDIRIRDGGNKNDNGKTMFSMPELIFNLI